MGKSSLVLLCCAHFIGFDQAYALSHGKTTTIYGLEQGSRLKIPKHSTYQYILQLGSFERHANAVNFKNSIAKQIDNPVHIVPVKSIPIKYNVIIGPTINAATLVNISNQLLAKITKVQIARAKNKKSQLKPIKSAGLKNSKKLKARRLAFTASKSNKVKLNNRRIPRSQSLATQVKVLPDPRAQKKTSGNGFKKQVVKKPQFSKFLAKQLKSHNPTQISQQTSDSAYANLIKNNRNLSGKNSLLPGFDNSHTIYSTLSAIVPDDQPLYQSPLLSTANQINASLKLQQKIEPQLQASSLPNLSIGSFISRNPENNENQHHDQNWEKNLFLGIAEEDQRTRAWVPSKGRTPDITEPLPLEETREDQSRESLPLKNTDLFALENIGMDEYFRKRNDKKPNREIISESKNNLLIQLAFAGKKIPPNILSSSKKGDTLIIANTSPITLPLTNSYLLPNYLINQVKALHPDELIKFVIPTLTYNVHISDAYQFGLMSYQLTKIGLHKISIETKKPLPLISQLKASPSGNLLSEEMINQIKTTPYNDELFKLSVQTLVYNAHISDAYQLALIAVKNRPNSLTWHEKLAQLALWVGDYSTGLKEWFYVVNRTKNPTAISYLINISKTLGFEGVLIDTLKIYLAKNPNDTAAYIQLAQAQNREGLPQQALTTLQNINGKNPTEAGYELSGKIYDDLGEWDNELKVWQAIDKMYGPSVKSVMAQAVIYYSRGQIREAVDVLKLGIPSAKKSDVDFWQSLADLAWLINDKPTIVLAYSHLPNDLSSILRLIQVEIPSNPMKALNYSLRGWHDFQYPPFLLTTLYLGQKLNKWDFIIHLLLNLSDKQLKLVEKDELFWQTQATYYSLLGAQDLQRKVLFKAISLHPKMNLLTSDLMWLVISNGEELLMKALMEYVVEQNLMDNPLIWHVFAQGLDTLERFYSSILFYQKHFLEGLPEDPQILIDYIAVLDRAKRYQHAYDARLTLWQRELIKATQIPFFDKRTWQVIAQLSPFFVSGTDQIDIFNTLIGQDLNLDDINILLNWIVPRNYYALMAYFKANYYHNVLPDWAGINLALIQNDLPTLQSIIEHKERTWPRSDRINAAERLENLPLAVDFAFQELTDRPTANEIFPEYTIYALKLANYAEGGGNYEQFINIVGPKTKFETRVRLTNSLRLTPSVSVWSVRSKNHDQITHVPNDYQTKIKLEQTIHRGNIKYSLGYRRALSGFVPASLDITYKLGHKWTANVILGYNQEVFQNSYLRIGGVQDQINLILYNNITKKDLLTLEAQGLRYYSQDRHFLSSGYNLFATFQHKLFLNYPDFTLGIFGHSYHFDKNGSFGGNITTLFPNLAPGKISNLSDLPGIRQSDFSQLIPQSYGEAGAYFSFGDTILEYTHVWRPYLWASLFYNTITRLSNDVKGGINGTVFGRDSLLIYLERGSAPSIANATNYIIGARYKIWF